MSDDWRTAIDIPPVMHSNPIPMASKVGNVLFSSGISGRDQATGKAAETIDEQCAWCFRNLAKVLELGGATMGDVGRVLVWMRDPATRVVFNKYWVEAFPDEHSRPARHTFIDDHGPEVTMEIIAVIEPR
jgi:2-iminobutanoate/2-iminopropanoate deaminase